MYHLLPAGTHLYRVTDVGRKWREVVSGVGSYYTDGGRYNRIQQRTVYASTSATVSIAENAAHVALHLWQPRMGQGALSSQLPLTPPVPPLVSEHLLWEFTINADLQLIDVEHPTARTTFHHRLYELLNPSEAYRTTADLADRIRHHPHPQVANSFVGGILAPSVRTWTTGKTVAKQHVLFVPPNRKTIPSTYVQKWRLTLEFRDNTGQSVTANTRVIDWARPWFQLSNNLAAAQGFASNVWHQFRVKYA